MQVPGSLWSKEKPADKQLVHNDDYLSGFREARQARPKSRQTLGLTKGVVEYFSEAEAQETDGFVPDAETQTRTHKYSTRAVYEGEWKGNARHGKGKMTWRDGASYEGEWQKNQACGKGTFSYANGDVYTGSWERNKANGFGEFWTADGSKYESQWEDDLQHGHGVEKLSNGDTYEGEYKYGNKDGRGKLYIHAEGSVYDG